MKRKIDSNDFVGKNLALAPLFSRNLELEATENLKVYI